jgi:hypothetical protein
VIDGARHGILAGMTPEEFRDKWHGNTRSERSAAQSHFIDLCGLLGVDKPGSPAYEFEKSTRKIGGAQGFADVWKDGCFIWEYKGSRRNLVEAYAQLKQYADAFGNPPLLIVSDMQEIRVHTNFTNTIAQQHVIQLGAALGRGARSAAQLLSRSRQIAADPNAGERHRRGGGPVRQYRHRAAPE